MNVFQTTTAPETPGTIQISFGKFTRSIIMLINMIAKNFSNTNPAVNDNGFNSYANPHRKAKNVSAISSVCRRIK